MWVPVPCQCPRVCRHQHGAGWGGTAFHAPHPLQGAYKYRGCVRVSTSAEGAGCIFSVPALWTRPFLGPSRARQGCGWCWKDFLVLLWVCGDAQEAGRQVGVQTGLEPPFPRNGRPAVLFSATLSLRGTSTHVRVMHSPFCLQSLKSSIKGRGGVHLLALLSRHQY